jgi:CMP-N,N'-diacetyllegionaminic acid synthase
MIALIPARKGSKGLKKKNMRLFDGKPLIQHSFECGLACSDITDVYVSTDSDEIISLAQKIKGIHVPYKRPDIISGDNASVLEVYFHFCDWWESKHEQALNEMCVLLPTSPLRLPSDISGAIHLFRKQNASVVVSVKAAKPILWHRYMGENAVLSPIIAVKDERSSILNRQVIQEKPVVLNGSVYIFNIKYLRENRTYFGSKTYGYRMPDIRSIDIDNEEDFLIAEAILKLGGHCEAII